MVLLFFYKLYHPQGIGRKYASYPVFHRVFKNILERNVHGMFLYVIFFHIFDTNQNMVSQWHTIGFAFWSPFRQTKGICGKRSGRSLSQCLQWNHLQDEAPLGGTVLSMGLVVPLQRGCLFHRHGSSQTLLSERISAQTTYWSSYSKSLVVLYIGWLQRHLCCFYGACCVPAVSSAAAPPQTADTNPSTVKLG